ncbi:uncharacterized protein LOC144245754 isoform X3 [Crocuta crocuta]
MFSLSESALLKNLRPLVTARPGAEVPAHRQRAERIPSRPRRPAIRLPARGGCRESHRRCLAISSPPAPRGRARRWGCHGQPDSSPTPAPDTPTHAHLHLPPPPSPAGKKKGN